MEYFISWTCLDSCRTRGFHLPLCRVGRGSATGNNTVMWNTRLFTVAAVPSPKFTLPVSVSMIEPNILAGHSTTQWKDYCVLLQLNTAIWQVLVSKIEGKVFSGTFRESPKGGRWLSVSTLLPGVQYWWQRPQLPSYFIEGAGSWQLFEAAIPALAWLPLPSFIKKKVNLPYICHYYLKFLNYVVKPNPKWIQLFCFF